MGLELMQTPSSNLPYVYRCPLVLEELGFIDWDAIPRIELSDCRTGAQPALRTYVQCCRSAHELHVRFYCEEDGVIVSSYTERDDPLYKEDVVEIFIDEGGDGSQYKEIEVSPRNVIFDAAITNDNYPENAQGLKVNTSWDMEGMVTSVIPLQNGDLEYQITIPFSSLDGVPLDGQCWKINFYRIDQDAAGIRRYWAWSPTYHPSFHLATRFGILLFD